jgi:predicted solute-binding protein
MHEPLRVGAVSYLNALPLTRAMRHDAAVALVEAVPSAIADGLSAGEIDVGLVPVIDMIRNGWGRIPGLGIVSEGPVETVLLQSRVPFSSIDRLGLDVASRTSTILVRLVLAERLGVQPRVEPADPSRRAPDLPAWLVIGDPAFRPVPEGVRSLDLGEAWTDWTGLPMVYAMWATRPGLDPATVAETFHEAARQGQATLEAWLPGEAARRGVPSDRARRYLREVIGYEVGERAEEGLARYEALAREKGLL